MSKIIYIYIYFQYCIFLFSFYNITRHFTTMVCSPMIVCNAIKKIFWLSVGIMFLLFIGFVSTIVVRTTREDYMCDTLHNATKFEIVGCEVEIAMRNGYEVLGDLFNYYDKNTNITGTQSTTDVENEDKSHENPDHTPIEKKRNELTLSSTALRSHRDFIECISNSDCGIVPKCYYDLSVNKKYNLPIDNINGSIFIIKNYVPFHVDYFWDAHGCDNIIKNNLPKLNHVRLTPNSAVYIDSLCIGVHTLQLYIDPNQTVSSEDSKMYTNISSLASNPNLNDLEPISTVLSSNLECAKQQACRYLNTVCFSNIDESERCEYYGAACNYFTDTDESAKNYCLQDCFYLHHPTCIPPNATLKSESIVQWVCQGGGIEGSSVDGNINTGPVIALAVAFSTAVVMLVGTCVSLHSQKRKLVEQNNIIISNFV